MTLARQQWLLFAVALALLIALVVVYVGNHQRVERELDDLTRSQALVHTVLRMRNLAVEVTTNRADRQEIQWQAGMRDFARTLQELQVTSAEEALLVHTIKQHVEDANQLFRRLLANFPSQQARPVGSLESDSFSPQMQIAGALNVVLGDVSLMALRLSELHTAKVRAARRNVLITSTLLVVLLLMTLAAYLVAFRKMVLVPINQLQAATDRIASGDFRHRLGLTARTEIGDLGRRFDHMAIQIRESRAHMAATNMELKVFAYERARLVQQLSEADRRKDEFLAMLAHELRNPLAPIRNSLELMKRARGNGELIEQARSTMERQIRQMVRLVDDLLDVSRITRNKLELKKERVELASVVHHAVETCRPDCVRAGHELNITLPPEPIYLQADPVRLAQVFGNLLSNSCKYMGPGGRIWLTAERQGSEVVVTIKDTGVGIPPEMLLEVFELFTQVDRSLERSESGLGIGLSLVKRLVEMHGGTVTAHSEGPGRGSEFVVRLPVLIEKREAPPLPEPTGEQTPLTARRILVVDDNRDSADSLAMLLELAGNETRTAHDGVEAVEKATAFRPEVILLDIGMPKMSGYDVCRAIREQPWGKDIVMVALTGWGQYEDRRKSKEAGFDGHLVKPADHAALTNLLASLSTGEKNQLTNL